MESPSNFPTTADYAMDAAQSAHDRNASLAQRVRHLEERVVALENLVGQLTYRLDHMQAISDRDRLGHDHERASRTGTG